MTRTRSATWAPLALVMTAVALQLASALILKLLADRDNVFGSVFLLGVGLALAINLIRVFVWGFAHSRFPLSHTYPLASLFFPFMASIAYVYGERLSVHKVVGALLITVGVVFVSAGKGGGTGFIGARRADQAEP